MMCVPTTNILMFMLPPKKTTTIIFTKIIKRYVNACKTVEVFSTPNKSSLANIMDNMGMGKKWWENFK